MTGDLKSQALWRMRLTDDAGKPDGHARKPAAAARLSDAVPAEVLDRINRIRPDFNAAREAVARGKPVEETPERMEKIARRAREQEPRAGIVAGRVATADTGAGLERVIGKDDILLMGFLSAGMHAARAVGRISRQDVSGICYGTGFLVGPLMVMTNNHVLRDDRQATAASIAFEVADMFGDLRSTRTCRFSPERFFFTNEKLDITIVALTDTQETRAGTESLGWHPMVGQEGKIHIGDPVNIIQYPGGRQKSVVMHNSNLMHLENDSELHPFCWYTSDTERGSSGAPVFNNRWEVIGVHHRSIPRTDDDGNILATDMTPMTRAEFAANPERALFWANEGSRTSRIVAALEGSADHPGLRDELLALWEESRLRNMGQISAREGSRAELPAAPCINGEALLSPMRPEGDMPGAINLHFHFPR